MAAAGTPRAGVHISLGPLLFPEEGAGRAGHPAGLARHPGDDYGDSPRDRLLARLEAASAEPARAGSREPASPSAARDGRKRRPTRRRAAKAAGGSRARGAEVPSPASCTSTASGGGSRPRSRLSSESGCEELATAWPSLPAAGAPGGDRAADASQAGHCGFEEGDTTVMLRNIPHRYTATALQAELRAGGFQAGVFDFFYLPMDFGTTRNLGYCFVNLSTPCDRKRFVETFHHYQVGQAPWARVLEVTRATTQGYEQNLARFRSKDSRRIKNECFRPQIFSPEVEGR